MKIKWQWKEIIEIAIMVIIIINDINAIWK